MKRSEFRSAVERIEALPVERLERIKAGSAAILEEMHLGEVRKALRVTQVQVAERSGLKQGEVSRIERAPETVQLRTLERYAASIGGRMRIVLDFPDGTQTSVPMHHGRPVKSKVTAGA